MNSAVINIKTNPQVKEEAHEVASQLGMSLSALINGFLKELIKTKKVTFSADGEPSEYLLQAIKRAEEDLKNGKASPVFKSGKEAVSWLEKQGI